MKVKCIDNRMMILGKLSMGQIYEVLDAADNCLYQLRDDLGEIMWFDDSRFEVIEEEDNNMENTKNKVYNIDIFNWEDFKNGKIAVLCNTEELAKNFLDKCDEQGITLGTSVITNGIYSVVPGHYDYRWYQSYNIKVIQWEIKNNEIEKTFREVIADIKEGEVWENSHIRIYHIESNDNIVIEDKEGDARYRFTMLSEVKFRLKRKQYTFEEAFKAYEEGKEIEGYTYRYKKIKNQDAYFNKLLEEWVISHDLVSIIDLGEIRGKWYIND